MRPLKWESVHVQQTVTKINATNTESDDQIQRSDPKIIGLGNVI